MKIREAAMLSWLWALVASVLICSSYLRTRAQGVGGDVKDFVSEYVAALNAKNVTRLDALLHPQSLTCVTPETKSYYDEARAAQMRDPIAANYTLRVSVPDDKELKSLDGSWRFPVRPTRKLQIEYRQGEDSGILLLWLVQENGRWFEDDPCATEKTLKEFHDDEPARQKRIAHSKALAAAIKEPLRSELIGLLREHKTTTATMRYQKATGSDYETSMLVIYELTPTARQSH
jgi:hypothetical protein